MAATPTGKERMIDCECKRCGHTWQDPEGLVAGCAPCIAELAEAFWQTMGLHTPEITAVSASR